MKVWWLNRKKLISKNEIKKKINWKEKKKQITFSWIVFCEEEYSKIPSLNQIEWKVYIYIYSFVWLKSDLPNVAWSKWSNSIFLPL